MIKPLTLAASAFLIVTTSLSTAQTSSEFDDRVRDVLLRNPEIILEVFALLEGQQEAEKASTDQELIDQYSVDLFGSDQVSMSPVLVEFVDYQCGYCRAATPIVKSIIEANPEIELRLIQLPILGAKSSVYAEKMLAVLDIYGQQTYLEMHEIFLGENGGELQNFDAVLVRNGLSPQEVNTASQSEEIRSKLAANLALARSLGVNGTPGFITRTRIIRGFAQEPILLEAIKGF